MTAFFGRQGPSAAATSPQPPAAARPEPQGAARQDDASSASPAATTPETPESPAPDATQGTNGVVHDNSLRDDDDDAPVEPLPVQEAPPTQPEPPAETPFPSAGGPEDGNEPPTFPILTEEGADLPGFLPSPADLRLRDVLGDYPHRNPGKHLAGGVTDDRLWQQRWRRLVAYHPRHYGVPSGRVGRRFVQLLANEFRGVRDRKWNGERPLVFATVVLQATGRARKAHEIRRRLTARMDAWEAGKHPALVDDSVAERANWAHERQNGDPPTEAKEARRYNALVLSGRL